MCFGCSREGGRFPFSSSALVIPTLVPTTTKTCVSMFYVVYGLKKLRDATTVASPFQGRPSETGRSSASKSVIVRDTQRVVALKIRLQLSTLSVFITLWP